MNLEKQTRGKQQRGVAMIMALLALFLLAIIGLAFMTMTGSENSANGNYKDSQRAYFASRAGLENVRALLWTNAALNNSVSGLSMPDTTNKGMIYVLNPTGGEAIDPTSGGVYVDDELCHEQFVNLTLAGLSAAPLGAPCGATGTPSELMPSGSSYYTPTTLSAADIGTANPLPFKWVRITNKQNLMGGVFDPATGGPRRVVKGNPDGDQVCYGIDAQEHTAASCALWNANPANLANQVDPVWVLTSLALTPLGTKRITQMEVAFTPPIYAPGTITTQAPVNLTGSYSIQSDDFCTCTCTQNTVGTGANQVTTTTCVTKTNQVNNPPKACLNTPNSIFSGGSITQNGTSGGVISTLGTNVFTSSAQNVSPWPFDINKLINTYKAAAQNASTTAPWKYGCTGTPDFTKMPPVYASCGTQTSQNFGTFPPNLLQNGDETGAMPEAVYVPGSVKLTSDANGAGILIVDGDLEINGGLNYYGLLLVRGKVSFTGGGSQATNLYGAVLAGEDVSASDIAQTDKFGGSINFKYDQCALRNSAPPGPPKLLATHEVVF
jgi:hypothetical protein